MGLINIRCAMTASTGRGWPKSSVLYHPCYSDHVMTTIVANALEEAEASNAILGVAKRPATEERNAPYDPPDCTRHDDNSPPHLSVMGPTTKISFPKVAKLAEESANRGPTNELMDQP